MPVGSEVVTMGWTPAEWAKWAIEKGKGLGDFLRDLPLCKPVTREQVEPYVNAYRSVLGDGSTIRHYYRVQFTYDSPCGHYQREAILSAREAKELEIYLKQCGSLDHIRVHPACAAISLEEAKSEIDLLLGW
jgi:hypothetical protein